MGTRSKTTIYNEENEPILSFYRQFDGYFEGHGAELQEFLLNRKVVNGYCLADTEAEKVSNGMSCLAATLVAHFKKDIGGIYITNHDDKQEFNYHIRYVRVEPAAYAGFVGYGHVTLHGEGNDETKRFPLYEGEIVLENATASVKYDKIVEFLYRKNGKNNPTHRRVGVFEWNDEYITGLDLNDDNQYKAFKVSNITNIEVTWEKPGATKPPVNFHNVRDAKGRFVKG